jgi:hypothetical protein
MNDEEAEWSVEQALLGRGDTLRERIAALPRLLSNPTGTIPCRICATPAIVFDVVDYHKLCDADPYRFGVAGIPVTYYRCPSCCCIFTNFFDRWSPQDFKRFIYNRDYELVDPEFDGRRASCIATELAPLLGGCETARILAYGPSAVAVAAAIAAHGFAQVEGCDPLTEARRPAGPFDVVAGFDTLERTAFPLQAFDEMRGFLSADGGIILNQTPQPANIAELRGNWRHIAPRNGHVSGFAEETLQLLADRLGFVFRSGMGRCGFLQPTADGAVAAALARLGPIGLQLGAPAGEEDGWYGPETSHLATRFRWTHAAEITWPSRRLRRGTTRIRIPFLIQIQPDFARSCRLFLGETPLPTEATANAIIGLVELPADREAAVRLMTPPPASPSAVLNSQDTRRLGLAIPILG